MKKEERYKLYELYEYHSTKSNRELRKIFDNSNWNYNIQLFRACEEIINELQQENQQYKNKLNKINTIIKKSKLHKLSGLLEKKEIEEILSIIEESE